VRGALTVLLAFTLGVGAIAIVLLVRLASADHVGALVIGGRLAAPTGYFNSTAALFTIEALTAIALAARRELPGLLRGALMGFACAGLQLAVIVQSRGWLFTLPLIALGAIVVLPDRLRVVGAALLPVAAPVAISHPLRFVSRQWNGFSHTESALSGSHFTDVGSGRYDFWRVSLDAFTAHPAGGLGQDNFAEYYVRHRRTSEEPAWTHSLELRLLT